MLSLLAPSRKKGEGGKERRARPTHRSPNARHAGLQPLQEALVAKDGRIILCLLIRVEINEGINGLQENLGGGSERGRILAVGQEGEEEDADRLGSECGCVRVSNAET